MYMHVPKHMSTCTGIHGVCPLLVNFLLVVGAIYTIYNKYSMGDKIPTGEQHGWEGNGYSIQGGRGRYG